jgi:hypothetical protein
VNLASVAVGDFNGDGRMDLVGVGSANFVRVSLGNGDGTFGAPITSSVPVNNLAGLYPVVVADFDADGNADLAIGNAGDNNTVILFGHGDGTFGQPVIIPSPYGGITVADFNCDGLPDLAIAHGPTHSLAVVLNHGDRTFSAPVELSATGYMPALLAGDLNGDGKPDLITVVAPVSDSTSRHVVVFLGNGDGTFAPPATSLLNIGLYTDYDWFALEDLNGDGKLDLVLANGSYLIAVLMGNGDGTFGSENLFFATPLNGGQSQGIALIDLNGDNRTDVVVDRIIGLGNELSVYYGNGDGTFPFPKIYSVPPPARFMWSLMAADFNGDGRVDFASVDSAGDSAVRIFSSSVQPALQLASAYGSFSQGEAGATFTLTVSNAAGMPPTSGGVSIVDYLPSGLSLVSMSGSGWVCNGTMCTRSDTLASGSSYPPITVKVNVGSGVISPQPNEAIVSGGGSLSAEVVDNINIQAGTTTPATVHIDAPLSGSVLSGTAMISGWALDNSSDIGTAISSVQVMVDGVTVGNATYGVNRPDVCNVYPGRLGCPNVGFTYLLNLASLSAGSHTITVSATDSDAIPDVGSANVSITVANGPPNVYIDSPTPGSVVSGVVAVSGWSLDTTSAVGTAISGVQVKVDGTIVGTATYGISRPDVCGAYSGRAGCPNVGFTFTLNTSSLSPGAHQLTATATDSDVNPDAGSWSVIIQVAVPPSVTIDMPTAASAVSGMVTVAGWAIDNTQAVGTTISSVQVKVDGTVVGAATYGVNRPDVCAAYGGRPGCPNVGYTFALNTATLTPGQHTITVAATDSDGSPDVGSATITVTVAAALPSVTIDLPANNATVSGTVTVAGWTIDNTQAVGTAISSVQVKVDGTVVGAATYGVNRPDVCLAFPGRPGCPNVGYTFALNTAALTPGPHTITVTATDSDGSPDTGAATVTVTAAALPPSVVIDLPANNATVSGTVTVAGWAIDNTQAVGTAISSVQVKVDGTVVGAATYGVNRPDVCVAFPGRVGCPNVGYTFQLDTASLSAGSHTLTVTATDSDGVPDNGSASITIVH